MSERGDVFAAIADLISKGHGKKEGYKPDQAVDFCKRRQTVVMSLQRNSWDTNRGGFCDERTVDNGQNIWK